jgi:hypothetical protein
MPQRERSKSIRVEDAQIIQHEIDNMINKNVNDTPKNKNIGVRRSLYKDIMLLCSCFKRG